MKSFSAKLRDIKKNWYYVNAKDKILGRLATVISHYLRGKHKVEYTPHMDTGDYIIVINAEKVLVTGNKKVNKIYHHHTGYIGGIKSFSFEEIITRHPERVIEFAVKGMLPKGALGRIMFRKLRVYSGDKHHHTAQNPKFLNI